MKFGNTLGQEGGYGFMVFIIKQRKKFMISFFFFFFLFSLFACCWLWKNRKVFIYLFRITV